MKLASLTIARNEDWAIGLTLRAALMYVDEAIVLDHASTDRTPQIIAEVAAEHPGRVIYLREDGEAWHEMAHRQRTLMEARKRGATHCAIVDADEVLCGDLLPSIRESIDKLMPGSFLAIPMRNLHRSIDKYRSDASIWGMRTGTMLAFCDTPKLRWHATDGYDHHQRSPIGSRPGGRIHGLSGIMHLQFASWRRLLAKHANYKILERLKYPAKPVADIDRLYSMAPNDAGALTAPCPPEWWGPYAHLMRYLDVNAEPWQEAEVRRLVGLHGGAERFAGLDLFGVDRSAEVAV